MPANDRTFAWILVAVLAVGACRPLRVRARYGETRWFSVVAMVFDFSILGAFVVLFAFERRYADAAAAPDRVVAGAVRFGMRGGVVIALATVPVAALVRGAARALFDVRLPHRLTSRSRPAPGCSWRCSSAGSSQRLDEERRNGRAARAQEAEALRDELGRRADLLDAANRCARALSSSLDLDEAFGAFIRELRGLVPFDRMAIVLAEDGAARMIATAGAQARRRCMPPGTRARAERSLLAGCRRARPDVVPPRHGATREYAEEAAAARARPALARRRAAARRRADDRADLASAARARRVHGATRSS